MTKPRDDFTVDDLPEALEYNTFTGVFKRGDRQTGCLNSRGYVQIFVKGRLYVAHRIAWLMFYGHWPKGQIDHFNGVRTDNRIVNLRDVSPGVNGQNMRKVRSDKKTSSPIGVFWESTSKGRKKWRAQIRVDKKLVYLGNYHTPQEAHRAYLEAKRKYHPTSFPVVTGEQSMEPTESELFSAGWRLTLQPAPPIA